MNINLGPQWEAFISANIETGRYLSASEVVREGLRLLQEREQLRQARLAEVRKEVDKGLDALEQGAYQEFDEKGIKHYLEDVDKRAKNRLAKKNSARK